LCEGVALWRACLQSDTGLSHGVIMLVSLINVIKP